MNCSVKFLSPMVTAGLPAPGLPLGVDALLLLLELEPQAATITASPRASMAPTPGFALLCTWFPLVLFRFSLSIAEAQLTSAPGTGRPATIGAAAPRSGGGASEIFAARRSPRGVTARWSRAKA